MDLPISLHGNEYFEHLRSFRDTALIESQWLGKRRAVGGFIFGIAHAKWRTEENVTAQLTEDGLRYKNTALTRMKPTTLRLLNSPSDNGFELVTFKMDLDDIGIIDIYRNLITSGSFREIAKAELHQRVDRRHGLSMPTDEQREQLYFEMQRGASGLYRVSNNQETDDI